MPHRELSLPTSIGISDHQPIFIFIEIKIGDLFAVRRKQKAPRESGAFAKITRNLAGLDFDKDQVGRLVIRQRRDHCQTFGIGRYPDGRIRRSLLFFG